MYSRQRGMFLTINAGAKPIDIVKIPALHATNAKNTSGLDKPTIK